jgi:hypothetical protein
MRENTLENMEYLVSVRGIKENQYKEQILDYLELYSEVKDTKVRNSLIKVIQDNSYRLKLAYFGRFV